MTGAYTFVPATPEQVEIARKQLGTSEEDIRRAVASLRDWLGKQPHLPKQIDDAHIERMYIQCKCSIDRVKKGLDFYFSLRTRYPEILQNRDPMGTEIVTMREHLTYVVMPRLTKELYRLHICMDVDPDPRWVLFQTYGKITSMGVEMLYFDDYSLGDVFIIDMANVTVGHVLRVNINVIRAMEFIHKNAYCRRLKGLHFINCDSITDFVMKVLKVALTEKLQKRVPVHLPGSTTLFDHLEKEYIPDELGGTAGPVEKLTGEFMKAMGRKRSWFLEQDKYTSDESKRPAGNHYADDMYGAEGSFKKLTVD